MEKLYPEPRIELLPQKKLLGMCVSMTLADSKTGALWGSFMPRRKEIMHITGKDLFSMQLYPPGYAFDPHVIFDKWAAVEVGRFENIPSGMEPFVLEGGLYAVFLYKGLSTDSRIFRYIFQDWLPASEFLVDERPHFEILGEKYRNNHPDSEEEIWIPLKKKLQVSG